jgi:thiamine-monophosphate kinase
MPGEFDFLEWIRKQEKKSPIVNVGIGDDLAALNWGANDLLLVGVDQVIDGVHFDSSIHTPEQIGRKAMNRNLSDCAAMGCLPAAALAAVALPRNYSLEDAKRLYEGLRAAGAAYDCAMVGGDTGSWDGKLVLSVTIVGRSAGQNPVTRGGAKTGDVIYVSGPLGGSILGRHMSFEPRVKLGREIAPKASAMIDLSDGLSRDLGHICRMSNVGAVIEAAAVPIHPDGVALSRRDGASPLEHALNDGEDYELLLTSSERLANLTVIGRITEVGGIFVQDSGGGKTLLTPRGWEHGLGK